MKTFRYHLTWMFFSLVECSVISAQKEFYTPKALITPVHDKKNQLHISAGRGGGWDLNVSFSVSNHLAIFASGTFDKGTKKRISLFGDRYNLEKNDYALKAGFGFFSKPAKTRHYNVVEAYGGVGFYRVRNYSYFIHDYESIDSTIADFWNVFLQINVCRKENKQELTLALRLAYNKYTDMEFFTYHFSTNTSDPRDVYKNLWGVTADPVVAYSYKIKALKFNAQLGLSLPLTRAKIIQPAVYSYIGLATILGRIAPGKFHEV
ncbi:MAG: hypothetical protein E6H10_18440 [Bacteroidetes bacterium]|nr:MAG: hypothetical protein E6H10_18440 [Bacteroidota bacterium]